MRKDLLNRKEPALDDSEHFEPIQVVKYAQTRRLALGGVLWREAKGVAGQPMATAGKIRY